MIPQCFQSSCLWNQCRMGNTVVCFYYGLKHWGPPKLLLQQPLNVWKVEFRESCRKDHTQPIISKLPQLSLYKQKLCSLLWVGPCWFPKSLLAVFSNVFLQNTCLRPHFKSTNVFSLLVCNLKDAPFLIKLQGKPDRQSLHSCLCYRFSL